MQSITPAPRAYDFCFPALDTLVRVEEDADGILVRATRDSFTEARKLAFIRELASEGFIPDECRWHQPAPESGVGRIRWLVDSSWLTVSRGAQVCARRFMIRLLASAAVVWTACLMVTVLK